MATREVTSSDDAVNARRALLDALDALREHRNALVLVGAQAVYLYTGEADGPIATRTKDTDLAVVPSALQVGPRLEIAMTKARFVHDNAIHQPGEWISSDGHPVELLVPEALHHGGGRRGARIPPHSKHAARVVPGLEAAVVDNTWHEIPALDAADARIVSVRVASPAALLVSKAYKIGERYETSRHRLLDKDAHDVYRLLRASDSGAVAGSLRKLQQDPVAGRVTGRAVEWLRQLAGTRDSLIPVMAGRAEQIVGSPEAAAAATWALVQEVLEAMGRQR